MGAKRRWWGEGQNEGDFSEGTAAVRGRVDEFLQLNWVARLTG